MKKIIFYLVVVLNLFSCQKEEETIVQDNEQSFTKNAPIASLLSRVSQNPTAIDNVLDNTNCFSVLLPVTVTVNNQVITVSSEADYELVQNAIDAFLNDDDLVEFTYPITIKFQNFQTRLLTDDNDLQDVLNSCEANDFDEISCIAVVYPVRVNIYDSNNQILNTQTLNNDVSLYNFLDNLQSGVLVAINYPISMVDANGDTQVFTTNSDLELFIENSISECDEDSGSGNEPTLTQVLTSGTWFVTYYFEDDDDQTSIFSGYTFTFQPSGDVLVSGNSQSESGTWTIYQDGDETKLELFFNDDDPFEEISEDWNVLEFTPSSLRLKHGSGGGGTDYLNFTKN